MHCRATDTSPFPEVRSFLPDSCPKAGQNFNVGSPYDGRSLRGDMIVDNSITVEENDRHEPFGTSHFRLAFTGVVSEAFFDV